MVAEVGDGGGEGGGDGGRYLALPSALARVKRSVWSARECVRVRVARDAEANQEPTMPPTTRPPAMPPTVACGQRQRHRRLGQAPERRCGPTSALKRRRLWPRVQGVAFGTAGGRIFEPWNLTVAAATNGIFDSAGRPHLARSDQRRSARLPKRSQPAVQGWPVATREGALRLRRAERGWPPARGAPSEFGEGRQPANAVQNLPTRLYPSTALSTTPQNATMHRFTPATLTSAPSHNGHDSSMDQSG